MDFQNQAAIRISGTQFSVPAMTPAEIEIADALLVGGSHILNTTAQQALANQCRADVALAHFIKPTEREATALLVKLAYLRAKGWQDVAEETT